MESKSTTTHKQIERASDGAHRVVDQLGERADELMEMRDDWLDATRSYVRDHPVAALGIALAAGYVLSALMRGGRD
jgi:ElaB/YqjD/DUF883 family membrane-anchored ribosome-binding protein